MPATAPPAVPDAVLADALNRAVQHQREGRLDDAAAGYGAVLRHRPGWHPASNLLGVLRLQQGRAAEAEALIRQAVADLPTYAPYHFNLASALLAQGRRAPARAALRQAVERDPSLAAAWSNLGRLAHETGYTADARAALDRALALDPAHARARLHRGRLQAEQGHGAPALADLQGLEDRGLAGPALDLARADAWAALGDGARASACLDACLRHGPNAPAAAHLRLAALAASRGDWAATQALCDRAGRAGPETVKDWRDLACLYQACGDAHDAALAVLDAALAQFPDDAECRALRALSKLEGHDDDGARADLDEALALDPACMAAHTVLGLWLHARGDAAGERACLQRALALAPAQPELRNNLAQHDLAQHDFAAGWAAYAHPPPKGSPHAGQPMWDGVAPVTALRVVGGQGIGDQILFATLMPELQRRVPSPTLTAAPKLVSLLQRALPAVRVRPLQTPLEPGQAWLPMWGMGRLLRPDLAAFGGAPVRLLQADADRVRALRPQVRGAAPTVCGLSWRSVHPRLGARKSLALAALVTALDGIDGLRLVDLQYGDTEADRAEVQARLHRTVHRVPGLDAFDDLESLAAALVACDVVVTTSNTTAHLAGALGCDTLLLLPHATGTFWYWNGRAGRSLWYPTVRLFRQPRRGDWGAALAAMRQALMETLATRAPAPDSRRPPA